MQQAVKKKTFLSQVFRMH